MQTPAPTIFNYDARAKENLLLCPLCGQQVSPNSFSQEDRYGYRLSLSRCSDCSLLFLNPRLTATEYTNFYAGPYRALLSAFYGRPFTAETIKPDQLRYAKEVAAILSSHLHRNSHGRLLDIGGSTGIVASHLCAEFYLTGLVVDPCVEELENAAALGMAVVQSSAEKWAAPSDATFDLITICQTVDHFLDPLAVLKKARSCIRAGGLLYMDIVDADAASSALKLDHPFYFTEATATKLLWKAGFAVLEPYRHIDGLHIGFLAVPFSPRGLNQ